MRYSGFEPFVRADSELLILGSFPSVQSRACNFYYGNPRNRFWAVLADAYDDVQPKTVEQKKEFLNEHHIALWDVVTECEIEGSLDGNIKDYVVADILVVLRKAKIKKILLNGATAAKIFKRNFGEYVSISVDLPSTSPTNVRFSAEKWMNVLKSEIRGGNIVSDTI